MVWSKTQTLILVFLCAVLSLRCGDSTVAPPIEPDRPSSVNMVIDEHGGILALEDEAWVIVPPGAVDSALTFTITRKPNPPNLPANYRRSGNGYDFEPHGYTFNAPVRVSIACDPDLADPSLVKLDDDTDRFWEFQEGASFADETATTGSPTLGLFAVADFDALESVYVSTHSQGPNAAGTPDDPLPSISSAIAASLAAGEPYPVVFVAEGTYTDCLLLADGVSVHGGYDEETWLPVDSVWSVVEVGTTSVYASNITTSTVVSGLEIRAGAVRIGSVSSVALHLVSCTSRLEFVRCNFISGNGADGAGGADGPKGGNGGAGGNGNGEVPGEGGGGCYRGGRGGYGTFEYSSLWAGFSGAGPDGGAGGGAGWSLNLTGGKGGDGGNGDNGTGGTSDGSSTAAGWEPNAGASGTNGQCGSGGGGGGGNPSWFIIEDDGGGGGGGGAGGSGGGGGKGGGGGGSSFAVFLYESAPIFEDCYFVSGDGGGGGEGGDGNIGGTGGKGGTGGTENSRTGGTGGYGGIGGDGGGGQGGPGGHSYSVCRVGLMSQQVTFRSPRFTFGSHGMPGSGGYHGSDGTRAAPGAPGRSGELRP